MNVNRYKILLPENEAGIDIPIQMNWDFLDRSNNLNEYQQTVIEEVINDYKDFETARFAHQKWGLIKVGTNCNYEFYFAPSGATSSNTVWNNSYLTEGFTAPEVYYLSNSFKNSFFKLDLYDTTGLTEQKAFLTLILPTTQGGFEQATVGLTNQLIKKPKFALDYIGDKEGFFIYWLKSRDYYDISTFYMTAKFFDAKLGVFVKMMNRPQNTLPSFFNFPQENYFYYKVDLDYNTYTYRIYDIISGQQAGTSGLPIRWYEYINP